MSWQEGCCPEYFHRGVALFSFDFSFKERLIVFPSFPSIDIKWACPRTRSWKISNTCVHLFGFMVSILVAILRVLSPRFAASVDL